MQSWKSFNVERFLSLNFSTKILYNFYRCQAIVNFINQGLFNVEEGVIISEEALQNDPDYEEDHPLRRQERERLENVRQHFNRQRLDGTWIAAEFMMGKVFF